MRHRTRWTVIAMTALIGAGSASAQMMDERREMMRSYQQGTAAENRQNIPAKPYPKQWGGYGMQHQGMMGGWVPPCTQGYGGMAPGMMGGCGPGYGMQGYGMEHGMMGGYGMGPGMMHGYGMGPGMMGGYGMGPGMMGGYGMGYGMHGYGMGPDMMHGYGMPEDYQNFMNQTVDLRRKMHSLRFDYGEALRDPESQAKKIDELEKQMFELQQQLMEKAFNSRGKKE